MDGYPVELKGVYRSFGKSEVIRGFDLDLTKNAMTGIIGPTGAGKTTIMRLVNGAIKPTKGTVRVLGLDPCKKTKAKVSAIHSYPVMDINHSLKVKYYLDLYGRAYPGFDFSFAAKLLEYFNLDQKAKFGNLSTGQKALMHFIFGLSSRCPVTMFDEPFNGMDIEMRKLAGKILLNDYMEHPRNIIVASHILPEIEHLLSEVIIINKGEKVFYGDMDQVRDMMCEISGNAEILDAFSGKLPQESIMHRTKSAMSQSLVIKASPNSDLAKSAKALGLEAFPVTPEDVCIYLTGGKAGDDIYDLWNNEENGNA